MQKIEGENKGENEFKKRIYTYIIRLIKFLGVLHRDYVVQEIVKQLMRSGTSIGANYFEAYAASSKRDYQNYFSHSLKSANESKFWLSVMYDSGIISDKDVLEHQWLLCETKELANIFAASILTMKGRK